MRAADLKRLQARADLSARELSGVRQVQFAVCSGRGLDDEVQIQVEAGRILHFAAADLYAV